MNIDNEKWNGSIPGNSRTKLYLGEKNDSHPMGDKERTGDSKKKKKKREKEGDTYPCQLPPASTLRRFEERWRGWPCPRGVQELLREYPQVRGGGGSLHLRLRHPGHLHPRDSSTPSTWTQIRTHVMIATAAWRRPLPRPDPGKKKRIAEPCWESDFSSREIISRESWSSSSEYFWRRKFLEIEIEG